MAFDTVGHSVLLITLPSNWNSWYCLGLVQKLLGSQEHENNNWYYIFRRNGSHFCSTPGLCFGANLFNMYSITISKVIDSSLNLNGFADDHSFMKEFNPNLPTEEIDTIDLLVHNLAKIKTWMNSVRLKMNDSKSEFIIFGTIHKHVNALPVK